MYGREGKGREGGKLSSSVCMIDTIMVYPRSWSAMSDGSSIQPFLSNDLSSNGYLFVKVEC